MAKYKFPAVSKMAVWGGKTAGQVMTKNKSGSAAKGSKLMGGFYNAGGYLVMKKKR